MADQRIVSAVVAPSLGDIDGKEAIEMRETPIDRLPDELVCAITQWTDVLTWPILRLTSRRLAATVDEAKARSRHAIEAARRRRLARTIRRCRNAQANNGNGGEDTSRRVSLEVPIDQQLYVGRLLKARRLHLVKWAHKRCGLALPMRACTLAAKAGDPEAIRWLVKRGHSHSDETLATATHHGHVALVEWLEVRGQRCAAWTVEIAARRGHLAVLQWLDAHHVPISRSALHVAAMGGHVAVVEWLCAHGCTLDAWTVYHAAQGGHLALLKWLDARGCVIGKWAVPLAASSGCIDTVRWALARTGGGVEIDACTCAAREGHLEILQWLRQQGCHWYKPTCLQRAHENGHHHVVEWIQSQ